MQTDNVLTL